MFIFYALLAALFSGLTTLFAKIGLNKSNSTLVTGLRTIIIMLFALIIYLIFKEKTNITLTTLIFIILSGIFTSLLWLSYFKALSLANISLVTPIDKLSIVFTLILSFIFLNEKITLAKIISTFLIVIGTFLMTNRHGNNKNNWFIYAFLTAIFTTLSTILAKMGIKDIDPNLGMVLRTMIVLIIIWFIILLKKEYKDIKYLNKKNILFITLSGLSTGVSWLFYFKALKYGEASIVFPIEKLSAVVSIILSIIFLNEKLDKKRIIGFASISLGIILLIL